MERCANCGREIGNLEPTRLFQGRTVCEQCDFKLRPPVVQYATTQGQSKRVVAGVLGILLGGLGLHKFVLGYTLEGIIFLSIWLVSFVCCVFGIPAALVMPTIGLIEGIIYLTKSDDDFIRTYQIGRRPWF